MSKQKKAFVLMPFREPFDSYYENIYQPALDRAGYAVSKANDIYSPRPIMLDIQESIMEADLILCEMSEQSPNVFYELGLAHAVGKPAILCSSLEADIPFDLRHIRVIIYNTKRPQWDKTLKESIIASANSVTLAGEVWPPPLIVKHEEAKALGVEDNRKKDDARVLKRPMNLGFEGTVTNGNPMGWFNSVGHVGNVSEKYNVRIVPRLENGAGHSLMFYKSNALDNEFGSFMQRCHSPYLAGKAVRLEGELKIQDVEEWAGLWFRADGREQPTLFFDNMSRYQIRGTMDWKKYQIEAQLPSQTEWINFGVVLSGNGIVWVDNFKLSAWSEEGHWEEV